jgi:hypothetical protein
MDRMFTGRLPGRRAGDAIFRAAHGHRRGRKLSISLPNHYTRALPPGLEHARYPAHSVGVLRRLFLALHSLPRSKTPTSQGMV